MNNEKLWFENNKIENNKLWIDTRLSVEEMNFLNDAMNNGDKINYNNNLAGNVSHSGLMIDKDNWFYETVLKKLCERMFYRDWDAYRKYVVEKEESPLKFELLSLWANYQRKHEFNPLHNHGGLWSFVVFMKIPTHWEEQHKLSVRSSYSSYLFKSDNPLYQVASNFQFVWSVKDSEECITANFPLSSEDEGRMLFFPATLHHQVYPFYGTEEERVTISGNICLYDPNRLKEQEKTIELSGDAYEEKEKMIKMMENSIKITKKELKMMKVE